MIYKRRELQSLFEVKIYTGNPDAKRPKTKKETVIAWNHVDAIRQCGKQKVAEQPKFLHHVTWSDIENGPRFKIDSTAGPESQEIQPTLKA
jgi:hypothetical protein